MEMETAFDEIYQFTQSKQTEQYKKATIILTTFKDLLIQMGINEKESLGYLKLQIEQIKRQCQQNSFNNLDSQLLLLNKLIGKTSQKVLEIESSDIAQLMIKILNHYNEHEVLIEKYSLAILGQCLQFNQSIDCYELIIKYSLSKQSQLRREALRVIKQCLNQANLQIQYKLDSLIKKYYLPMFKDIDNNENINTAILSFNQLAQQISVQLLNDFLAQIIQIIEVINSNELQIKLYLSIEKVGQERQFNQAICETLLNHFLQYYPSYDDKKQIFAYIQCISQVLLNLQKFDAILCQKFLGNVVLNISDYILQVNDSEIQAFAKKTIEILIIQCIDEKMWRHNKNQIDQLSLNNDQNQELDQLIGDMQVENDTKNYFYQFVCIMKNMLTDNLGIQQYVLPIIGSFFSKINRQCFDETIDLVKLLVEQRTLYNTHIWERCLEKLIFSVDVECLVKLFPMKLSNLDVTAKDFETQSNLWVLSLTIKYAKNQKLFTFLQYFYPLIQQIKSSKSNNEIKNSVMDNIQLQIWDCFHRFNRVSNEKQDIEAFKQLLTMLPKPNLQTDIKFNEKEKYFMYIIRGLQDIFENCIGFQVQLLLKQRARYFIGQFAKIYQPSLDPQKYLLGCIQSLSKVVEQQYCEEKYCEHMKKLLNSNDSDNKHEKNLEIILKIVQQVKLENENWQLTIEVLKKELMNNNLDLQKKMYKLLQAVIKIKDKSFLDDIFQLLVQSQNTVSPKSKLFRLQVICSLYELSQYSTTNQLSQFLQEFMPEIITYSRDNNQKLRKLVDKFVDQIYIDSEKLNYQQTYIQFILAGFTSKSTCTIADTIQILAQFIEKQTDNQILEIILQLCAKNNKEVYKACLFYIKNYIKLNQKSLLQSLCQIILSSLLKQTDEVKLANQSQLKFVIERIIRKCGIELVQEKFPIEHIKLLKSIQKQKKTEINKKIKAKKERIKKQKDQQIEEEQPKRENDIKELNENLLLEYDNENQKFHFVEKGPNLKKLKEDLRNKQEQLKDIEFKNGKMVVKDVDKITGQKRKRDDEEDENVINQRINDEEKTVYKRRVNKIKLAQQQSTIHQIKESGASYKARGQSKGDMKLKDKPEPYAFIQLNPKALNKRYRNKSRKVFDDLVNKKSTGALKGLKTQAK